jgi:hypothetical protein
LAGYRMAGEIARWTTNVSEPGQRFLWFTWQLSCQSRNGERRVLARGSGASEQGCRRAAGRTYRAIRKAVIEGDT